MGSDAFERWWQALCYPPPALKCFAWFSLICVVAFVIAYEWLDIPLARALQPIDPPTPAINGFNTKLGEGGIYLVPLGLVFVWAWLKREELWATRAGFVFLTIGVPGILADIAKPVFARARPVLFFRENLYGFMWGSSHANAWSFPSGHSITVTALAIALYAIYPAAWPAYALPALAVMASRVILDAHYLSDVIAGFYIGAAFAFAFIAAAQRQHLPLALRRCEKLSDSL
jgi:membrane-associated phospholipid phosphatase